MQDALFELFQHDIIALSVLLLGGFAGGKLVNKIKLPAVTGYLLAGILLSQLNIIRSSHLEEYRFIEILGLSIVALIIGGGLHFKRLKHIGKSVLIITVVQVMGAFTVVVVCTYLFTSASLEICILLGAIASATAPASPIAVIQELRAKGNLTDTLMAVVAMDDAACLVLFGICAAIVNMLTKGRSDLLLFLYPIWEIAGSIGIGILVGWFILHLLKHVKNRHEIVIILIGITCLAGELAEIAGMSALLLNMTSGAVIANFHRKSNVFSVLEDIQLPVFVVFFTLAGASLDFSMLALNLGLTLVYITARAMGKVGGAFTGANISNAPRIVKKYLGFAMLSQAGVAIALTLAVQSRFPQYSGLINAVVVAAVTVNELIGPIGTKYALTKAGETGITKT